MSVSIVRWFLGAGLPAALLFAPAAAASEPPADTLNEGPPRGSYVWVEPTLTDAPDPHAGGQPHVLYLNRCTGGTTISGGWPDDNVINRSGILGGTVTFPPFSYGDAAWEEVMDHTRQIFEPFNVVITDVDPSPAAHDEAIVCGSGGLAGFSGAGGVAPFTCGVIEKSITFTFPDSLGGHPRTIAEVIAQEAAHAWGLEHEFKCEDPMSYLSGCGDKTYQDGDYPCGEFSARACECGGSSQNSYQYILELFGPAVPDAAQPSAAIVSPSDGAVFEAGVPFDVLVDVSDDIGVTHVALFLDGALATEAIAAPFGPWRVSNLPQGSHDLYIEASDDAGKTTVSAVVYVEITADGLPPAGGDDGGGPGGNNDGGGDGSEGGGNDSFGSGDAGDPDALPPGFGFDNDAAEQGCSCNSGPGPRFGWLWALLIVGLAGRRRLPTLRQTR